MTKVQLELDRFKIFPAVCVHVCWKVNNIRHNINIKVIYYGLDYRGSSNIGSCTIYSQLGLHGLSSTFLCIIWFHITYQIPYHHSCQENNYGLYIFFFVYNLLDIVLCFFPIHKFAQNWLYCICVGAKRQTLKTFFTF